MEWKLFADLAERAGDRHVAVDVEPGETVEDALDALLEDREDLRERVLDERGELRSQLTVLRNGGDVHARGDGLATTLDADDELALLPPVSGG
ncbi:ubiquitin-like small modifier protein 1 [Halovivax limisalsi]|uniref:ubiquitin-like small modifier protein 1 n=1 Tax=Halovivax limisalsi TaxID=1453760 RepID=UPI001FFC55CC|nr:ubiquitin-like small modifier protein 1 [Halovivax limisalsi]